MELRVRVVGHTSETMHAGCTKESPDIKTVLGINFLNRFGTGNIVSRPEGIILIDVVDREKNSFL